MGSPPLFSARELSLAWGSTTGFPRWSIGVMTMKMMSSTSTTSTSGVTLMSLLTPLAADFHRHRVLSWRAGPPAYFSVRPSFMKKSTSSVAESVMSTCMSSTRLVR